MSNTPPLVSVICLSFNHKPFVIEALQSVLSQSYPQYELIIVDDASTDGSMEVIEAFLRLNPSVKFICLKENAGNCKAFNEGLKYANGDFIIDLASDDVLLPGRIEEGVNALTLAGEEYGVNFTDAVYIDAAGNYLNKHSDRFPHPTIPQGDVYVNLIRWFFICPPTMMFRKKVMDELGGYDGALSYEDFDFWIRSSRKFKYCYTPTVLVKKRVLTNSLANRQFISGGMHRISTFKVCEKIFHLNKNPDEKKALRGRLLYEIWCSLKLTDLPSVFRFTNLLVRTVFNK